MPSKGKWRAGILVYNSFAVHPEEVVSRERRNPMIVTVNLSPELAQFVNERVASGEFRNAEEMVRAALARLLDDGLEAAHTEALLREAEESGDYIDLDEREWDAIEREAMEMAERRKANLQ